MPSAKPGDIAVGALGAIGATYASRKLLPPQAGRVRLGVLLMLLPRFAWLSLLAGIDVARRVFSPNMPLATGFVDYRTAFRAGMPATISRRSRASCRAPCRRAKVPTRSSSIASTPGSRSQRKWPSRSACSRARWCRVGAMTEFLLAAAGFVLAMVALGLVRILRGPGDADRMMAAQLLGSGGIAALLLGGAATGDGSVADVSLTLALLAAFASIAFVKFAPFAADDASES